MNGNYSPGALNKKLNQKRSYRKRDNTIRKCPKRDNGKRQKRRYDNRATTSDAFRDGAEDESSKDRANVVNDRDRANRLRRKFLLYLQKCRIDILGSVAERIE